MKDDHDEPKAAGIATFMRSPYLRADELDGYSVAVLGAPVDHGTSYREGARHAPRALREHSSWDRIDGRTFHDFDTGETVVSRSLRIADVGDVRGAAGDAEATQRAIAAAVSAVRRRSFPLILGGDHSITYGAILGCLAGLPDRRKPLGVLHFDAHPDLEGPCPGLPRVWHGNPLRCLIEEGHLTGDRLVSIGLRGLASEESVRFARERGVRLIPAREVQERGLATTLRDATAALAARCRSIYVSFDIDCLDPADAPGTGTPELGGLRAVTVGPALRVLAGLPLAGFDLVEVSPSLDPSGLTVITGCEILWRFLLFGFDAGRDLRGEER